VVARVHAQACAAEVEVVTPTFAFEETGWFADNRRVVEAAF
jgi:hypothetical protein